MRKIALSKSLKVSFNVSPERQSALAICVEEFYNFSYNRIDNCETSQNNIFLKYDSQSGSNLDFSSF